MKRPLEVDTASAAVPQMAGGLGDIMGGTLSPKQTTGTQSFTSMERILLSANGNLQRLISSYHNSPVTVSIRKNERVAYGSYDREVVMSILGVVFARATSKVSLERDECIAAVEEQKVGIGQLFRHFNILPQFDLLHAGHTESNDSGPELTGVECLWRDYVLRAPGITCNIHEVIRSDVFELQMPEGYEEAVTTSVASFGDIIAPTVTFLKLPLGFTSLQRLLLSANGNVERILSSYYAKPLSMYVVLNHKRAGSVYDRQSVMLLDGRQLMLAKTTVFISKPSWSTAIEEEGLSVGSLFAHFGELPTFELHATGSGPDYFFRQYALIASGMTCFINETFNKDVFTENEEPELGEALTSGWGI